MQRLSIKLQQMTLEQPTRSETASRWRIDVGAKTRIGVHQTTVSVSMTNGGIAAVIMHANEQYKQYCPNIARSRHSTSQEENDVTKARRHWVSHTFT